MDDTDWIGAAIRERKYRSSNSSRKPDRLKLSLYNEVLLNPERASRERSPLPSITPQRVSADLQANLRDFIRNLSRVYVDRDAMTDGYVVQYRISGVAPEAIREGTSQVSRVVADCIADYVRIELEGAINGMSNEQDNQVDGYSGQ